MWRRRSPFLCPCVWTSNARENEQIGIVHSFIPGHHVVSCELPSPAEFGQLTGQGPVPTTARQVDDPEMGATAACVSWLGDITRMSWDRACGEPWGWDGTRPGPGPLCSCRLTFPRRLAMMDGLLGQPYFYILASGHAQWGGGGDGKCRRCGVYFRLCLVLCVVRRVGTREVAYVRHDRR